MKCDWKPNIDLHAPFPMIIEDIIAHNTHNLITLTIHTTWKHKSTLARAHIF